MSNIYIYTHIYIIYIHIKDFKIDLWSYPNIGFKDEHKTRTEISSLRGIRAMAVMPVESRERSRHALDTSCKLLHTLPSAIRRDSEIRDITCK